jgi:hypothetical protein
MAAQVARKHGPGSFPTRWNPHTQTIGPMVSQRATVSRDPYMGDPGIFGSIGRFIGGAVSLVPGVGGLVGGGITRLANTIDPIKTAPSIPALRGLPILQQQAPQRTGVSIGGLGPGGAKPYARFDYAPQGGPAMSGYHYNKADYFLRDGTFVPKGSKLVKNRRRNPANSKATNRAISRVAGAKKHAQTLSRITIRKASCK